MKRFSFLHLLLGICLLMRTGWSAENETAPVAPFQLKAAYIRHLIEFTNFPATADAAKGPIVIGLLAEREDPVADTLSKAVEQLQLSSKGIPLKVIWIPKGSDDASNFEGLHVLYVSSVKYRDFLKQSDQLRDRPILTVGEAEAFVELGGMVGFKQIPFSSDQGVARLKLLINRDETLKANITISSRLLRMKSVVEIVPGEEDSL